jgi:hypothetical protein
MKYSVIFVLPSFRGVLLYVEALIDYAVHSVPLHLAVTHNQILVIQPLHAPGPSHCLPDLFSDHKQGLTNSFSQDFGSGPHVSAFFWKLNLGQLWSEKLNPDPH